MALRNFTRNLHMFLDNFELSIQNKRKNCLGKTVLEIWSQICSKIAMLVHKITLKKNGKKVKTHRIYKLERTLFS